MTPPLVTVYIPCRNYGKYLPKAVESVLGQLHPAWELFLVDEGSEDDTRRVMEDFQRKHAERIFAIHHPQPVGLQRTANEVLGRATGKYFIRLDADDWLDEGALLLMTAKLEANDNLGIVYGNYYYTDPEGNVLGIERRHALGVEDLVGHLPPHGACTMVRTRVLKAVGGYSEDIDAQDGWELWYKLLNHADAANLNSPVFYYRQHGASLSQDSARLLSARSRIFERLAQAMDGSYRLSSLAVLGVRESYPGIKGVPYQSIGGRPLLQHAIDSILSAQQVTDLVVSSKSEAVLAFSKSLEESGKVPRHHRRLRETLESESELPIKAILLDAGEAYREEKGEYPDIISFYSLHSVNRTPAHIDKAINVLRVTKADSVVSVQEERSALFSHGKNGLNLLNPGRLSGLNFQREQLFRFNGAIISVWWDALSAGSLLGDKIGYVEMSHADSAQFMPQPAMPGSQDN